VVGRGRGVGRLSNDNGGVVSRGGVHNGSRGVGLGLRVDWGALVGHLGHVAVHVVGCVLHGLDTAVREGDGVGPGDNTVGIACLGSVEVSLGVIVSHAIGVGVGFGSLLVGDGGRSVGRLSHDNWGVVGRGGMDDRSRGVGGLSHDNGGVVSRGGVHNGGRGVGWGGVGDSVNQGSSVDSMS